MVWYQTFCQIMVFDTKWFGSIQYVYDTYIHALIEECCSDWISRISKDFFPCFSCITQAINLYDKQTGRRPNTGKLTSLLSSAADRHFV